MLLTPKFWDKKGFIAHLLLPLAVIYFILKRIVEAPKRTETKFKFFSIIVGNAVVGGAGKTPTVIAISNIIKQQHPDKKTCIITKGYGGKIIKPSLVNLNIHNAEQTGDEAQILAKISDVIIAKNRLEAAKFAEENGYEIAIFDDGIHDRRIKKDISLLVIEGKYGIGNGIVFPAGPMRDRLDITAKNATHIALIGKDEQKILEKLKRRKFDLPIIKAFIQNTTQPDKNENYIAFAGIGRPEKFFDMLRFEMKLKLLETISYPDHYSYENDDLNYVKSVALKHNAKILTTEKDFVKLPETFQKECEVIKIELVFEDKSFLTIEV